MTVTHYQQSAEPVRLIRIIGRACSHQDISTKNKQPVGFYLPYPNTSLRNMI